jgi:hypothetical protein
MGLKGVLAVAIPSLLPSGLFIFFTFGEQSLIKYQMLAKAMPFCCYYLLMTMVNHLQEVTMVNTTQVAGGDNGECCRRAVIDIVVVVRSFR